MKSLVPVTDALCGKILAENLYDAESNLLLRQGVELTASMIALLRKRHRDMVAVESAKNEPQLCDECGTTVGLVAPNGSDKPAKSWVCNGCGAIYFGAEPTEDSELLPVDVILEPTETIALSPNVERAFSDSLSQAGLGAEKRRYKRHVLSIPATVVPLDRRLRIVGNPVRLITHDISLGGVCLKQTSPMQCPHIYVDFTLSESRKLRKIATIVRSAEREGAFEIGCEFTSRVVGHGALPTCSVTDCNEVATCEVYRVNVYIPEGELFFERDDTCLYLCTEHVVENEQLAQGERKPRGIVHYPHTNQRHNQGYTIYKPLGSRA